MMFFVWMLILAIIAIIWAYISVIKERQRHEVENAKKEISTGRVIFHSSSVESESL